MEQAFQEFDKILGELFETGIAFLLVSTFALMFNKKIAHMLRMIAYLQFISILIIVIVTGLNAVNSLVEALNNLTNWSLFGGFKD